MENEILPIEQNSSLINSFIDDNNSDLVHRRLRSLYSELSEIEPSEESSIDPINNGNLLNESDILDINSRDFLNNGPNNNLNKITKQINFIIF